MKRKSYRECLEDTLKEIATKWAQSNIYYVGGYVRDELMNVGVGDDVDLVIDLPDGAHKFVEFLKKEYPTVCVDFVEYPRYGTAKFTLKFAMTKQNGSPWIREIPVECVEPRREEYLDGPRKPSKVYSASIEDDAKRRDFCCNALYKNVITKEILDPTGHGVKDIDDRILRTPTDPETTYKDDPLRMLRAIRFSAAKDFEIEENTYKAIKPIPEYYKLSMERVRSEFTKILCCANPQKYIIQLHETKLLGYIIPELEEAWGFNQNSKYHSMNLSDHTLSVLEKASKSNGTFSLILAALLHDISKYKYHELKGDGTFSYHEHEIKSAEMAESILKRLTYSNDIIEETCLLIRNHMGIKSQYDYDTTAYTGTKKSMVKFLNKIEFSKRGYKFLDNMLSLIDADNMSHAPNWNMPGQIASFRDKMKKYGIEKIWVPNRKRNLVAEVSGDDIMKRFSLPAGKSVGYLKEFIKNEFQVDHPDYDKETLLDMCEEEFGGDKFVYIKRESYVLSQETFVLSNQVPESYPRRDDVSISDAEGKSLFARYPDNIETFNNITYLKIPAIQEPELWMRVKVSQEALGLIDTAFNSLEKLALLPGFSDIKIEYDNCNDASIVINWKGRRPTIIY